MQSDCNSDLDPQGPHYESNRRTSEPLSHYQGVHPYDPASSLRRNMPLLTRLGPSFTLSSNLYSSNPPNRHSPDIFGNNFDSVNASELDELIGLGTTSTSIPHELPVRGHLVPTPGSLLQSRHHYQTLINSHVIMTPLTTIRESLYDQPASGLDDRSRLQLTMVPPRIQRTFEPIVGFTFIDFDEFEKELDQWAVDNSFMVILMRSQRPGGKIVQATFGCFRSGVFKSQARNPVTFPLQYDAHRNFDTNLTNAEPLLQPSTLRNNASRFTTELAQSHPEIFQKSAKTNCPFQLNIRYSAKNESFHITKIINEHNHSLVLTEGQLLLLNERKAKRKRRSQEA